MLDLPGARMVSITPEARLGDLMERLSLFKNRCRPSRDPTRRSRVEHLHPRSDFEDVAVKSHVSVVRIPPEMRKVDRIQANLGSGNSTPIQLFADRR
jgi:hypothetical protein